MSYLIINADDFGYSPGVNRGIIKAHTEGIVTSTSVMVDSIAASEAGELKAFDRLSVGLHFVPNNTVDLDIELDRQLSKFVSIVGNNPTHIDIHKVKHDDIALKERIIAYAQSHYLKARYAEGAKYINSFFGPHANGYVSIEQLKKSLAEATAPINELMCHVGYADEYLINNSSYSATRELELETICSAEAKDLIAKSGLELINWSQV